MSDIKAVKEDEVLSTEIKDIADRYSHVFQGIGKIRDNKNGQDFYAKFSMRPEAVPVAQKPRPVAYYLQEPLKKWLEQCLEEEIFEEVPEGEPVTLCSPLVVQPKPKFSELDKGGLEPHRIRASVDLRIPNQFMERDRITQSTVVEDFMYKFHNCTVFSKLDMKQRYHQLLLDPESRKIATFSTPWGNMRPKRLIFGAKSSQDLFDEAIYRIFGDIPRWQVTTRQHRIEPIKSTETPKKPWDVVAVDFGGPYPDGHYNLLAIDKRTRYPEVSKTLTSFPTHQGQAENHIRHPWHPKTARIRQRTTVQFQRICRVSQDRRIPPPSCDPRACSCKWRR